MGYDGNDKKAHQFHLRSKRYVVISPHGFSLVRAAVDFAILERISGFATSQDLPDRDYCKFICGAPTIFQGYGIK